MGAPVSKGAVPKSITIDIADLQVSDDPEVVLVTYALGSCIAVMVHDPVRIAAGMIHYMLPLAKTSPEKAKNKPAMFADTGIPLLFEQLYALGCCKEDLVVKVAGGGRSMTIMGPSRSGSATTRCCGRCFGRTRS